MSGTTCALGVRSLEAEIICTAVIRFGSLARVTALLQRLIAYFCLYKLTPIRVIISHGVL